ncbi:hypothetical protein [Salinivibrio kushneri]|uniref:hypothetical protein n=1 Tax=Salinivibrio kushneri TaxID=1908198 RepID=UPI001301797F|nr:hypothetical protein [Salinivibrio kushneri]
MLSQQMQMSLPPLALFLSHLTSKSAQENHCQRQFKIDPLIGVIAEVKLTHPRN